MTRRRGGSEARTPVAGGPRRRATGLRAVEPRRVQRGRREDPRRALTLELAALRGMFDESAARFTGRIAAELERAAALVEAGSGPGRCAVAEMLAIVRGLRLKPHKGRLKDLSRVEAAVEALTAACGGDG